MNSAIRVELDALRAKAKNGLLMPRVVIAAARNPRSALHNEFTWDKNKALEMNLYHEAQRLISEYVVVIMSGENPIKTRQFVSLTTDRINGGGYRAIADVFDDEAMTQQLLADALAELAVFRARYARLQELAGVFRELDLVAQRHTKPRKTIRGEVQTQARQAGRV